MFQKYGIIFQEASFEAKCNMQAFRWKEASGLQAFQK